MNIFIPKKIIVIIGVFIALLIAYKLVANPKEQSQVSNNQSAPMASTSIKAFESDADKSNSSIANIVRVTRVVDGDTIEIEGGERVRYIGIDTPETVDPRKTVQCFGVEASKKNKELMEGKMARLEKDITDRDKYNRLLRYVYVDNTFINLALVEQGFAKSYSYPPDIKYQDQFVAAEKQARENKRGLWTACGSSNASTATTPSVAQTSTSNTSCTIKGNISASGEKIYHVSVCGSYTKTFIDENRGERWFCSETEAQTAGWRKALNCP